MKNHNKGFTLIELLIVVAIIGILSAIVLISLNSAKTKAKNASIKSSLSGIVKPAEVYYYNNNNSYENVCSSTDIRNAIMAAAKVAGLSTYFSDDRAGTGDTAVCRDIASAWAAEVPLPGSSLVFENLLNTNSVFAAGVGGDGGGGDDEEAPTNIKMWCVDSTGKSKQTTASIGTGYVCPN